MLIYTDADNSVSVDTVFLKIKSSLNCDVVLLDKKEINLKKFDVALGKLKNLKPLIKPQLLKSCAVAITGDKKITPRQVELYRAIASILDCPMPPLNI